MENKYYPYECPDFRLKHHHTDELVEISVFTSNVFMDLGSINGIRGAIAMAGYLCNGIGSA